MKKYIYLSLILLGGLFTACTEGPDYSDKVNCWMHTMRRWSATTSCRQQTAILSVPT